MSNKTKNWIVVAWIAYGITLFLAIDCIPKKCSPLRLADQTIFIIHEGGRTEILLLSLNISDRYVFGVIADVVIQHNQTKEIIDQIRTHIGDFEPTGMKEFSIWTDRLIFGDDVGVRASFTYAGMR